MSHRVPTKVGGYVVREGRVAVFEHRDFPGAGLQVPAGTVEPGEHPAAAVVREVLEESGLIITSPSFLGETDVVRDGRLVRRRFYVAAPEGAVPNTWEHVEHHRSDGGEPLVFVFRWMPIRDALQALAAGLGDLLHALPDR